LVSRLIPQPTRKERLAALRQGIQHANQLGLTRVHSAGGDNSNLDLVDELRRKGELTLRFYVATFLDPPTLTQETIDKLEQQRTAYHDDWIDAGAAKFLGDGVIEAHTAGMLEPYSDDPTQTGKPNWTYPEYARAVTELDRRGFQIFTHAIGDRTIREALDGFAEAHAKNGTKDSRDRVEHIEDPAAAEIPRFGSLGVIASMQPLHMYPDEDTLGIWARNVGPERATRAWPWQDIASSGGHLAFGSDWPVVTLNPWPGLQILMTRETDEGTPSGGWFPAECLTLAQGIEGYTLGAAYAGRREKTEGSLEPGKVADLIIISQDLFHTDPRQVRKTEVLMTMVGGKVVYHASAFPN
jgi:predicted amidohydrolase YtcJ